MTLSGAPTPGQSRPRTMGIKEYSAFPKASPSDCLVSYPGHLLGESYPFAEMQSVYSAAPADWSKFGMTKLLERKLRILLKNWPWVTSLQRGWYNNIYSIWMSENINFNFKEIYLLRDILIEWCLKGEKNSAENPPL